MVRPGSRHDQVAAARTDGESTSAGSTGTPNRSPAAVIAPDLARGLEGSGVPADLARRCAAMVERLVAVRYDGAAEDARSAVAALVEELQNSCPT